MIAARSRKGYALALVCAASIGASPSSTSVTTISRSRIDAAVASLDHVAMDVMRRSGVPGMAIAVVHDGNIVYVKGFGVRKIGTSQRVDGDTVFQVASVSKPLASTVVAGVVGSGRVKWEDPVAKYIPGFTLADPWVGSHVTIADLFAHRSGLPDHAGDLLEDLGYDRATIIQRLALEPLAPFRITYAYTNFGLTAAAQAVANAEGTSWEALLQRVLYGPLGMTHTSSRWADYNAAPDRATLHVRTSSGWKISARRPDAQSPAGGASSSVRDLARWMIVELDLGRYDGRQVIDRDALLATQQPLIVSNSPEEPFARAGFYGLGMGVSYDAAGRLHLSHSGAFASGAATTFELLPSEGLGIVILTNGTPTGVPESIAKTFYDRVEFGKVTRDWYAGYMKRFAQTFAERGELIGKTPPAQPAASSPLEAIAGRYANAYYGPAVVSVVSGNLVISLGPKPSTYTLRHWDGNVFWFDPGGENGTGPTAVRFTPADSTHPAKLAIEYLNEDGLGTFSRT